VIVLSLFAGFALSQDLVCNDRQIKKGNECICLDDFKGPECQFRDCTKYDEDATCDNGTCEGDGVQCECSALYKGRQCQEFWNCSVDGVAGFIDMKKSNTACDLSKSTGNRPVTNSPVTQRPNPKTTQRPEETTSKSGGPDDLKSTAGPDTTTTASSHTVGLSFASILLARLML